MDHNNHNNQHDSDDEEVRQNGPVVRQVDEREGSSHSTDDEDLPDYSHRSESPVELLDRNNLQNSDRIPLIPTDFSSISEALQNFRAVFESRYGAQHAPFYDGPLQNAITDAFDNPLIEERRPLALYLHNDNAVGAHIFPERVLCSMEISNLLKCQYLVWGWDMTQQQNSHTFFEWMNLNGLNVIGDSIRAIPQNKYPLLVILVKEKGQFQRSAVIYGQENTASTIQKLMLTLDHDQQIKEVERKEERSRMEREAFRREQAEEYERSLAADRAKQQELRDQRQRALEEEQKKIQEDQDKQRRMSALAKMLPDEPDATDPAAVVIRFRCPDGELKERRFRQNESIEMIVIYSETVGFDQAQYRLWTSDRPRREVGKMDTAKTFAEIGWPKREQITIEEV